MCTQVVQGYRLARDAAFKALTAAAVDHSADKEKFREDLINIAKTTLSSKVVPPTAPYPPIAVSPSARDHYAYPP